MGHYPDQQDGDGNEDQAQQENRIGKCVGDAAAQLAAALEVVGKTTQGIVEATTGFTGADEVYIQPREQSMLLLERNRQRRAAAHGFADAFEHLARVRGFGKLDQDAQRTIERLSGAEQGCQLLGELQDLRGIEFALLAERKQADGLAGLIGAQGLDRQVALVLQSHDHFIGVGRFHLAVERFARGRQGLVAEQGHLVRLPG